VFNYSGRFGIVKNNWKINYLKGINKTNCLRNMI
jgi:hypothetical protein